MSPVLKWWRAKLDSEVSTKGAEVSEKDLGAGHPFNNKFMSLVFSFLRLLKGGLSKSIQLYSTPCILFTVPGFDDTEMDKMKLMHLLMN